MHINETIVVEGKHDEARLKAILDVKVICTDGTHLSRETLALIKAASARTGIIVFTDPDHPGESIRNRINREVSGCKNAFIDAGKARAGAKVGIEHAAQADIIAALAKAATYGTILNTVSIADLRALGLIDQPDSEARRQYISTKLCVGHCNGKQLLKRLNMLAVTRSQLQELLAGEGNG